MRFRKTMSVIIAAAMLTSTFCAFGASAAEVDNASAANSVDSIVLNDFTTYPTYSGTDLGSTYSAASTTFKVWAPSSTNVTLNLYKSGDKNVNDKISEADMKLDKATGVWSITIDGDIKNTYYTYRVFNENNPNGVEVCDIYAKAAGVNGDRAMVVDLDSTNPAGWENDNFQRVAESTDASVWEVHIKDFSYDPESGVSEANRGKYLAFTEFQTTLNNAGDVKTCMNYLKDLGIKYVQINPMYDFGSVDEAGDSSQFNWGYDPKNYNVPEGSYSSDPTDGNVRINEMKQMIKALHDNGIGVIMDVVYNHTYASDDSWFNLTVPNYYYRQNADGSWSNGSGCGNDTASEREMFKKFMVESVTYWANEYHIDGFRFDLMGLHDLDTMNLIRSELDKIDSKIITYGEGWTLSTTTDKTNWAGNKTKLCKQTLASQADSRIGFFNDTFRDAIKGKAFDDLTSRGYVSGSTGGAGTLYQSIIGQRDGMGWKTTAPTQNVVYASCHDNQTLWDRFVASEYGYPAAAEQHLERNEQFVASNKLSSAITFTSQGVPFILAGEEFARTKLGDHNSYKSAADLNMLDWSRAYEYADVVSYYKGMLQIRDNFDAFSDATNTTNEAIVKLDTPKGVIGYKIPNLSSAKNQWSDAVVYFNGSLDDAAEVTLPNSSTLMGDVDGDGKVTAADSLSILRYSVHLDKFTADQEALANVNSDSKIDSADALSVLRMSVKLEPEIRTEGKEYVVIANDQTAGLSAIETVSGKVSVQPSSALILVPKDSYDKVGLSDSENARVVVNHIDKATNEVLKKVTLKGTEGQAYTTQKANDLNLEYDLDAVPNNATGKMTKGVTEVNYYYNLYAGGVGSLTVKYVDENGKSVADARVTKARAGTEYTTAALDLTDSWYKLVKTPSNASGKYTKEGVEVVYTYKYDKPAKSENLVDTTVHVKVLDSVADEITPCLYFWDDEGKNIGTPAWPGNAMKKGADGWYTKTFQSYYVYNWIVNNNGGSQTSDRAAAGDIWIVISGSDLSKADNVKVYTSNPDA